jgi:hypothetical protein
MIATDQPAVEPARVVSRRRDHSPARGLGSWGRALTAYAVLTVLAMWPALSNLTTTIMGSVQPGDATAGGVYLGWESLVLPPFASHTPYVAAPDGAPFWQATFVTLIVWYIPQWLLAHVVGAVGSWNLVMALAFVADGLAMFGLVGWLVRKDWIALVAGILYAFSPFHVEESYAHIGYVESWIFPLVIWAGLALFRRPNLRRGLVLGALVGSAGYLDPYYILFVPLVAVLMSAGGFLLAGSIPASRRRLLAAYAAGSAAAVAVAAPLAFIYVLSSGSLHSMLATRQAFSTTFFLRAQPWEYVVPWQASPIWGRLVGGWVSRQLGTIQPTETSLYLGSVVLVLAAGSLLAAWRAGRSSELRVQSSELRVQSSEVQGSRFKVQAEEVQSSEFRVQGEVVQRSAFNVQRKPNVGASFMAPEGAGPSAGHEHRTANAEHRVARAETTSPLPRPAGEDATERDPTSGLALPVRFVTAVTIAVTITLVLCSFANIGPVPSLPVILWHFEPYWRTFTRLQVAIDCFVILAASISLALLSRWRRGFLAVAVAVIAIVDGTAILPWSSWSFAQHTPTAYRWLASHNDGGIVANYPMLPSWLPASADYLTLQTVHHHPLFNGAAPGTLHGQLEHGVADISDPQTIPTLRRFHVRYVVLDKNYYDAIEWGKVHLHGLRLLVSQGGVLLYRIRPGPTEPAALTVRWGFNLEHPFLPHVERWIGGSAASLGIDDFRPGAPLRISFSAYAWTASRFLRIYQNNRLMWRGSTGIHTKQVVFTTRSNAPLVLKCRPGSFHVPGFGDRRAIKITNLRVIIGRRA